MNCGVTTRMEGKPSIELPTSMLPVSSTSTEAAVHAIVYLKRNQRNHREIVALPDGIGTRRFCDELFSVDAIRKQHEKNLTVFNKTPAFELHYTSLDEGISGLKRILSHV
jgi:hypothetical protein